MGFMFFPRSNQIIRAGIVTIISGTSSTTTAAPEVRATDYILAMSTELDEAQVLNGYCSNGSFTIGHKNLDADTDDYQYIIVRF